MEDNFFDDGEEKLGSYTLKEMQSAVADATRRMEPVHIHWRMLEAIYRTGAQRELTMLDINRILPFPVPGAFLRTVNMVLPHFTMIINAVVQRDPKFVVIPVAGDDLTTIEENGKIAGEVLDYFWKRSEATVTLRDMTQDMIVLGNGFAKVGWAYSESTIKKSKEELAIETSDLAQAAAEVSLEAGLPLDPNTLAEIVSSVSLNQQLVEQDEPFVEYVSPYDIFLPAEARRMNTARWVVQRLRLPMEEIEANPLFDKEAVKDLNPDSRLIDNSTMNNYEQQQESLPKVFTQCIVYEFYDMKARTLTVFQKDAEKPLFHGDLPYDHRFPPFVHMRNYTDGGTRIWAFGDLENVAGIQLMINEIMQAELNDLKRVGNKYFINRAVMTPEISKALQENKPDSVIPIDLPANLQMQDVLQSIHRLPTPSDNYYMEGKLQDYMQKILGISDFMMGDIQAANRTSGTAAAAVEGAATTRSIDKMSNVEAAAKEVATRMLALCQQFLDNAKAIRIAGPEATTWLQVTEQDIAGEFSIDVEGGSTSAINPMTRARQGQDILTNIVPMLQNLGYDPEPTMRMALTYMGLNPDNMLIKLPPAPMPPQPGQEQQAMPMQGQPDENSPQLQQLLNMGAPPVPLATQGGLPNG